MTCRQGAAAVLRIAFGYTIMRVKKELIYTFPAAHQATLAEVGGKGLSLIEGSRVGFPVPPGFIRRFF
jgi:hypothetical protein